MWAVQTPQAFRSAGLRQAVAAHPDDLGRVTDDASLIEREGGEVLIHEAPAENLKVTTLLDLQVAQMLLDERKRLRQVGERAREGLGEGREGLDRVAEQVQRHAARTARVAWPIQSPVSGPTA